MSKTFTMKYPIKKDYLPTGTNRRSGTKMPRVGFIVLHDVGNDGYNSKTGRRNGTTARNNISYYRNTPKVSASAQTFIDDEEILECIPVTTGKPEKAWHVLYNRTIDNKMYGDDANDIAIGVELCYFPEDKERSLEAYRKFVWYCAYLAFYFNLDPRKCFTEHETLDPGRKSDPSNGLKWIGKTTKQCKEDIIAEYEACRRGVLAETIEPKGDELTMSQYKELLERIEKLEKEKADLVSLHGVGASHKESWDFAVNSGITNGQNPSGTLTRQQFTTMLKRFYDTFIAPKGDEPNKTHEEAWKELEKLEILNGENPKALITREQVATVVSRVLKETKK